MKRALVSLLVCAALPMMAPATAAECLPQAQQAWIRLPPAPNMPMLAGFVRLHNPCANDVAITGADSLAFADVSLHESRQVDGVNTMREVDALPIAAGATVMLKPGGLHLMLYKPYAAPQAGDKPVITLKLKDGRSLPVVFEVRKSAP